MFRIEPKDLKFTGKENIDAMILTIARYYIVNHTVDDLEDIRDEAFSYYPLLNVLCHEMCVTYVWTPDNHTLRVWDIGDDISEDEKETYAELFLPMWQAVMRLAEVGSVIEVYPSDNPADSYRLVTEKDQQVQVYEANITYTRRATLPTSSE